MKCLPTSKIPSAKGNILHDWHAEVLAIRSFNHFILQECKALLTQAPDYPSPYLRPSNKPTDDKQQGAPFIWNQAVTLHMYCSEAPCGDASMELTMSAQDDASPWSAPLPPHLMERHNGLASTADETSATTSAPGILLLGRACFSRLGVVRRKPARADAPPTLSKSCSDKLALKQCTSLLCSLASLVVSPRGVYLSSLVVPGSQFSREACERSFSASGRMARVPLVGEDDEAAAAPSRKVWEGDYEFRPFLVECTGLECAFSRRAGAEGQRYVASSLATAWDAHGLAENIIGGVLQGRKQGDPRGASAVSRGRMWALLRDVVRLAGAEDGILVDGEYESIKECEALAARRKVKEDVRANALEGWVRNTGDEGFSLGL